MLKRLLPGVHINLSLSLSTPSTLELLISLPHSDSERESEIENPLLKDPKQGFTKL